MQFLSCTPGVITAFAFQIHSFLHFQTSSNLISVILTSDDKRSRFANTMTPFTSYTMQLPALSILSLQTLPFHVYTQLKDVGM